LILEVRMDVKTVLVTGLTSVVVLLCAVLTLLLTMPRPSLPDKLGTLQCGPLDIEITEYVERVSISLSYLASKRNAMHFIMLKCNVISTLL
jgi:hypothetical protein